MAKSKKTTTSTAIVKAEPAAPVKQAIDTQAAWRAICAYGVPAAQKKMGLTIEQVAEITNLMCKGTTMNRAFVDRMRMQGLTQIDMMLQPQVAEAIESRKREHVEAAATLMRLQQTLVPGLKVPEKSEISGPDGKEIAITTVNMIDARLLVDQLVGAIRAKPVAS